MRGVIEVTSEDLSAIKIEENTFIGQDESSSSHEEEAFLSSSRIDLKNKSEKKLARSRSRHGSPVVLRETLNDKERKSA